LAAGGREVEPAKEPFHWWKHGVIYQIYPRSYQDSNGDGVGDLPGIRRRIGYLKELGVAAVWLSPIFPSPMADFGYDISDYTGVDPLFGNLEDFDALLKDLHDAGIKVLLDFVPNHTSDRHPWFLESRSSRSNPKRDWYLWQDAPPGGGPPNNWLAQFGGSAWEWDEGTGQYYYHAFLKEQPDLNWRNPEVEKAMFGVLRFWLDRGVDGFRVDALTHLIKDAHLRDNPPNPDYHPRQSDYDQLLPAYSADQPEVHDIVRRMRRVLDEYPERMMVGEVYLPINRMMVYYGTDDSRGVHLPFNFQLITLPWNAPQIAAAIDQYEGALPAHGWPNWVLGNHDQPRIASRVGADQAKVAALLLLTLRGTPTVYYGDEIGMRDVPISPDQVRDPQGLNMPGKNLSRDPARSPMQWDAEPGAGFTEGTPWLPLDRNFPRVHVERLRQDPHSILAFYRRLIALRTREPALAEGSYAPFHADGQVIAFLREGAGQRLLIALNLTHKPCHLGRSVPAGTVLVGTVPEREGERVDGVLGLGGDEGLILRLEPAPV
jgi:alpha-glucosidase